MEMRTLTKQVLNELIDHIDVYETQGTGKTKPNDLSSTTSSSGIWTLIPRSAVRTTADIREGCCHRVYFLRAAGESEGAVPFKGHGRG